MFEACSDTIARSKAPHLGGAGSRNVRSSSMVPQLINVDPNDGDQAHIPRDLFYHVKRACLLVLSHFVGTESMSD